MDHPIATHTRPISTPNVPDRYQGTALDPVEGGASERLGRSRRHPVTAAITAGVLGYIVMTAILLGLGYVLVHYLASGSVGACDDSVNRWFVGRRTATLNTVTLVGSDLGATFTVVGIGIVVAISLAIGRRWRAVGFLAVGLVIEVTVFLTTAVLINRPRPTVPKLDIAPPTSSFPSGHTAAAIVLYVSLAIIVGTLTRSFALRTLAWIVAIALPIFVALSRLYRGMHHPTDVMGSCVLGIGAIAFALLAARAAGAVQARTDAAATSAARPDERPSVPAELSR
jgi:undecaprenyl-diphosphatase